MWRYKVELYIFVVNIKCNLPAEKKGYIFIYSYFKKIYRLCNIHTASTFVNDDGVYVRDCGAIPEALSTTRGLWGQPA